MNDLSKNFYDVAIDTREPDFEIGYFSPEITVDIVTFNHLPDNRDHFARIYQQADSTQDVPAVRVHSKCILGDQFRSLRCTCDTDLRFAGQYFEKHGGILLYMDQEGRGIGFKQKMRAMQLQRLQGVDTYEANRMLGHADDERDYLPAVLMLKTLGVNKIKLLSGNPRKIEGLRAHGIEIVEIVTPPRNVTVHNADYVARKEGEGGHMVPNTPRFK